MIRNQSNGQRILVVDDLSSLRTMVCCKLTVEGYGCTAVADGSCALARLCEAQFDLVLLDIKIPGKSGMDVLIEITERYPDTPVIMLTTIADIVTAVELMKMGAYDYIIKPVNLDELIVKVDRALDRRRLLLENRNYQLHLEERVKEPTKKIRESLLNAITSLAFALEAKDEYTSGHSQRVAITAAAIARELGMTSSQVEKIRFAALVHDIGKIGIRESVLNKKDELTDEEYLHMETHSVIGQRILAPVIEDEEILEIVKHHHERYDGQGYPDKLSEQQIPQGARILAVADTYDAMTSDRPYRKRVSSQVALAELKKQTQFQFDPAVVGALFDVLIRSKLSNHKLVRAVFPCTKVP